MRHAGGFAALYSKTAVLWRRASPDRRGVVALEFAIVSIPFCTIVFFAFALGLHFFYQELLDVGLHYAVRQLQTGSTQTSASGNAFVTKYLCPATGSLLTCANLAVNVKTVTFTSGHDYYNITTGQPPVVGGALSLIGFDSASFCNAGPSQFILVTAIYTTPTILGGLLPNLFSISYLGAQVDVSMSQVAAYTENYVVQTTGTVPAPGC